MSGRLLSNLAGRWEEFWFTEIPPHSYAALRIAFGLVGTAGLLGLRPVSMFWWLDGILPIPRADGVRSTLIGMGLGHVGGELFYWALLAAFVCMTVGYQTRWAVVLSFAGTLIQASWNRLPLSGAHKALMVVLFCLVWARTNGVWAIDTPRAKNPLDTDPAIGGSTIWPLRLIRFQVALMYINSGLWKLHGATWRDGTAIYYAMSSNVFQRFPFILPGTSSWVLTSLTYVTLLWELAFVLLLFNRYTRRVALVMGVAIHLGLWLALEVGPFSLVMLGSYLAFLDPQTLPKLFSHDRGRAVA